MPYSFSRRLKAISVLTGAVFLCLSMTMEVEAQAWLAPEMHFRVGLEISAPNGSFMNKPVELPLDFVALFEKLGKPVPNGRPVLALFDSEGKQVLAQFDNEQVDDLNGTLTFICDGRIEFGDIRNYTLYFDNLPGSKSAETAGSLVKVTDDVDHEEQASVKVETPAATYFYHKAGGGFASMVDREGNDWLGYRPCCQSAGEYRGIPNMWEFHPGKDSCTSKVESAGPLKARIRTKSHDNRWESVWDIFPEYARMTLLKADGTYWFLYEGIPGGSLEVDRDYDVISSGLRRSIAEKWYGDIPSPEWIYFGDDRMKRTIFVAQNEDDTHSDQFWQMRGEMVVFGFGREFTCCGTYMYRVPATFTVGFAEDSVYAEVGDIIYGATGSLVCNLGEPEVSN